MSDQEQQNEIRQGALSGSMKSLHTGTIETVAEQVHADKIKKEKDEDAEMLIKVALSAAEEAYQKLIGTISADLEKIQVAMNELKVEMDENRKQWELTAGRLNDIDCVLGEVEDGKDLDTDKATKIIKSAKKDVPENATTADYLILLNQIKGEDRATISNLDTEYGKQEIEYAHLEHDQGIAQAAEKAVNDVASNDSLSDEEKEVEYSKINDEYGNSNFLSAVMNAEDTGQKKDLLAAARRGLESEKEQVSSSTISSTKLNW